MTRINSFIKPCQLIDEHLIAEIKEINQLTGSFVKSLNSRNGIDMKRIPKEFNLNGNHVYFFYDKSKYLFNRFKELKEEAIKRGFNIQCEFKVDSWPEKYFNDWNPSFKEKCEAKLIIKDRIKSRILNPLSEERNPNKKHIIRYYKKEISKDEALKLLEL